MSGNDMQMTYIYNFKFEIMVQSSVLWQIHM